MGRFATLETIYQNFQTKLLLSGNKISKGNTVHFPCFTDSANIKKCTEQITIESRVPVQVCWFHAHELGLNCLNLPFPSMPVQHQVPCKWNWLYFNATVSWKGNFVRYTSDSVLHNFTFLRILILHSNFHSLKLHGCTVSMHGAPIPVFVNMTLSSQRRN